MADKKKKFNTGDIVYHRSNDRVKWVVNESYNSDMFCKVECVTSDGKTTNAVFPTAALNLVLVADVD